MQTLHSNLNFYCKHSLSVQLYFRGYLAKYSGKFDLLLSTLGIKRGPEITAVWNKIMFVKYKNIKDGNTFKTNKHKNLKANKDIFHLIKKTHDYFLFHSLQKSLIQLS